MMTLQQIHFSLRVSVAVYTLVIYDFFVFLFFFQNVYLLCHILSVLLLVESWLVIDFLANQDRCKIIVMEVGNMDERI